VLCRSVAGYYTDNYMCGSLTSCLLKASRAIAQVTVSPKCQVGWLVQPCWGAAIFKERAVAVITFYALLKDCTSLSSILFSLFQIRYVLNQCK
jgi:hypothetical protein